MRLFLTVLLAVSSAPAQTPSLHPDPAEASRERAELARSLAEAGSSPVDYIRALESHLAKYPDSPQKAEIEKALAKAAMDASDDARIIRYGEKVLATENVDDLQLLDRLIRALLDQGSQAGWKQALGYAKRFENDIRAMRGGEPQGRYTPAEWSQQTRRSLARAIMLEARATGNLGDAPAAVALAAHSLDAWPSAEAAREKAWWLARLGRDAEAIDAYAEAFTMEDPQSTEADRAADRRRMGELYVKLHGSEKGLGDLILAAYDRTAAVMSARLAEVKAQDPNADASKVLDFTLPAVDGGAPLKLASLAGKTVVIDFWATWCGPCRIQHPMIENVRERLKNDPGVAFVSVDADDDHSLVRSFIREQHWQGPAYYEAGLMRLLNITSIPTVLVIDPKGRTSSRMTGFFPERFEHMLERRITEARQVDTPAPPEPGN